MARRKRPPELPWSLDSEDGRRPAERTRQLAALTPYELRVLESAARGLTITETAEALGVSVETVKSQRRSTLRKLDARNITHAVSLMLCERYEAFIRLLGSIAFIDVLGVW